MNVVVKSAKTFFKQRIASRPRLAFVVFVCLAGNLVVAATDTTASLQDTTESTATNLATTATETQIFASDTQPVQSVVLIGEKVSLDAASPVKGPFSPLQEIATTTLGGTVADFTSQGLTIAQTAAIVAVAKIAPPDIAVVFAGFTDEQQKIDNEQQRASLQALVKSLKEKNPAMRIFLVPAATTIGALTSANLLLVASDVNATYISLGTEVGGEPYQDALLAVKSELLAEPTTVTDERPEAAPPSNAVFIRSKKIEAPAPEATPSEEYENQKVSLQQELDRIAGESGNAQSLPSLADTTITTATDNGTTIGGGTLTKRGAEAQQSINMRPLPAVKAFRPQIPVPRNNVGTKEPALSR